MRSLALVGAALACAVPTAAAAPAQAKLKKPPKPPQERVYEVTFDLEMTRQWTFAQTESWTCSEGACGSEEHASGSERLQLRTPHPQRMTVTTGIPGQPPLFMGDTDANLRLKGHHRLNGTRTKVYTGAARAGNPDETADASDCGDTSVKTNLSFTWAGHNRLGLVTLVTPELLRERCPGDGWLTNLTGDAGVPMPDTLDLVTDLSQRKPGRVADFTARFSTTWHGTTPPLDRDDEDGTYHSHGDETLTWQWTAKFHQVRKTRRGRR